MQVAEIEITYCDYKVYMLQFKYGCYHALKSFGSLFAARMQGILESYYKNSYLSAMC